MAGRVAPKVCYSEREAADALGVEVETLRTLVRRHLARTPEEIGCLPVEWFQASDLLLLSLLMKQAGGPTLPDSGDSAGGAR